MKTLIKTKKYKAVIRWSIKMVTKKGYISTNLIIDNVIVKMYDQSITINPKCTHTKGEFELSNSRMITKPRSIVLNEFDNNCVTIIF